MKCKKVISGLLSFAMVATSIFTGDMTTVKADEAEMPEVLAYFDFDEDAVDGVFTTDGAKATVNGTGATITTEDKKVGDGALSLKSSYLDVKKISEVSGQEQASALVAGQDEITISYWSKSTAAPGWAYFIAPNSNAPSGGAEYYLGILDNPTGITVERYCNGRVNATNAGTRTTDWTKVDVVYGTDYTTLYVNGVEASTQPASTSVADSAGTDGIFYIGMATWGGGEYFTGLIDDYTVYGGALTAEQVRFLYDGESPESVFAEEGFTVPSALSMQLGDERALTLTLPSIVSDYEVSYESDNEAVATVADGKVTAVAGGTANITTTVTVGETTIEKTTAVTVVTEIEVAEGVVVQYDMTGAKDGKLVDLSDFGNDATIHNEEKITFGTEADGTPYMQITDPAAYLDLPMSIMDDLTDQEAFTIEATYSRASNSQGSASWLFCFGSIPQATGFNYLFYCPYFAWGGNEVRAGIKDSSSEQLFSTGLVNKNEQYYTINMVFDHGTIKLYIDGVKVGGELNSGYSIMDDVVTPGTADDILGYIGKSCWQQDTNFMGKFTNFKIYDMAMSDDDVQLSNPAYQAAFQSTLDENLALEDVIGDASADAIVYDLELPEEVKENELTWTCSNPDRILADGSVINGETDEVVTLTATMTSGALVATRSFELTVKALDKTELEAVIASAETAMNVEYADPATIAAVEAAIAKGKEANTQSKVNDAIAKIEKAVNNIKLLDVSADPFTAINDVERVTSLEVKVGATVAATLAVPDSVKDAVTVAYTSSNPEIATVDASGVVTGVKDGYTIVVATVTAKDGYAMEYQTLVKVNPADVTNTPSGNNTNNNNNNNNTSAPQTVNVSAVVAADTIVKGKSTQIAVTAPEGSAVKYRAKGAVSVNTSGKVTGKKGGTGTVYVMVTVNGKTVTRKVTVNVGDISGKATVKVKKSIKLAVKGISGKVKWSVNKPKLASISQKGVLKAKKKGKVVVTAKVGNYTMKKTITIKKK